MIVAGALSNVPFIPGMAWDRLHYVLGLLRLGHEVLFVEHVGADDCLDATGTRSPLPESENARLFVSTMRSFSLLGRSSLLYQGGRLAMGLTLAEVLAFARTADLLVDISGHLSAVPAVVDAVRRRAYLDADPVWTQLWAAQYGADLSFGMHDVFLTAGLNIGTEASHVPDCGIRWHPLPPSVVLEQWPVAEAPTSNRFTALASWYRFHPVHYEGEWYGSKHEEFVRFAAFPQVTGQPIEVALAHFRDDDEGVQLLRRNGWLVTDGRRLDDLWSYRSFIQRSRGELGIAQNAYVKGRSAWFSDRSAEYLASGRPVVAQSTGVETHLPSGEGFFTFRDLEEAAAAVHEINLDYEGHRRAARSFAEKHLSSDQVLKVLIDICLG